MARERTVLIIGGGGREHAIAWKMCASPSVAKVLVCPGNGGIDRLASATQRRVEVRRVTDVPLKPGPIVALALREQVDLVVVGPEAPLADGLTDALAAVEVRCFGPTAAAAQIEASKAFSKAFMQRYEIPTAAWRVFEDRAAAQAYLGEVGAPIVVKASGLAAGKGVFVCDDLDEARRAVDHIMAERAFGEAGAQVVIEERMTGPELSVMAFTDGERLAVMPAVQDHKAAWDGDRGPNTGGMGAYTPVPVATPAVMDDIVERVLQPTIAGLAAEGAPFRGVLYAGLMMTPAGLRVLEFNARFGDPETQVVLPILMGDLYDIAVACVDGRLRPGELGWLQKAAVTVVAASAGYPGPYEAGKEIKGCEVAERSSLVFHAGTRSEGERLFTAGGRVLAVSGVAKTVEAAVARAYDGLARISFEGMHVRTDIAHRALKAVSYRDAGVNIDAGNEAVRQMKEHVRSTFTPAVLSGVGSFGGLFDAAALKGLDQPVLVASTDGVGTKTMIASRVGRWDSVGEDIVNHCVDDILVQGARPLFFLDYVASAHLDPGKVAEVVGGMARACKAAGCALLGGETAEMPGVYQRGELDIAGTIVGVVDRAKIIDGSAIAAGHPVLALPSSGLHTNGFSLARKVLDHDDLEDTLPGMDVPLGEALLAPHRSYLPDMERLWGMGVQPSGLVHVTGGGLIENPPRILPEGLAIRFDTGAWEVPPLFKLIQRRGRIPDHEMRRVFNMGLGLLVVVRPEDAATAAAALPDARLVGLVVPARSTGEGVFF